jgi:hypothetical protein
LAKTRSLSVLATRSVELWQSADYRWRQLFEGADVMSEGRTRVESDQRVYYGSTSILLPFSKLGDAAAGRARDLARLVAADPHARLRAVRVACLEAQLRSGGPIGQVRAELVVRKEKRGIRVDVDVEARVLPERTGKKLATTRLELQPARRKRSAR